jgi:hypothetical protein
MLSPPLDTALVTALTAEFLDVERRFVLRDWEPTTLNGGQFAEIVSRLIYHIDSGNLNRTKSLDSCLSYIEDPTNNNNHGFPGRRGSLHLCEVLRTVYKLRSQRGAVHIDPEYSANELDSIFVVAAVRWLMSEILRIFWSGSSSDVASVIREIVRFDVPAVLAVDGRYIVLRTDCTVEEEILILLQNAGEQGINRNDIGKMIPKSAAAITQALKLLCSSSRREALRRENGTFILSPNGQKRIREELAEKLVLG